MRAGAIVLAAGEGRRMGGVEKAALALPSGETFLARILRTLALVPVEPRRTAVVHAPGRDASVPAAVLAVPNPRPEDGMLSSLQRGLARLLEGGDADAILLWPVDAPRVPAEVARAVLEALGAGADVAFPLVGGRGGHPAAFSSRIAPRILAAAPTASTREVLRASDLDVRAVPVEAREALEDIDTPEAYRALREP